MQRLFPEKLVTVITSDVLEEHLVGRVRHRGASGYTIVRARGAGSSGEQSGMLDIDTNIKFHVIMPTERLSGLLDDLEQLINKGHHLTVFVSDVSVLRPEKYTEAME
ncbi:P-II family nitrogen regulator [Thiohalophilus sp.]|uniref:P-II family nitrogen regulator n=1 Tax=Thiohalophilus sp. TaxID=3028392 RepID=UPI0039748376